MMQFDQLNAREQRTISVMGKGLGIASEDVAESIDDIIQRAGELEILDFTGGEVDLKLVQHAHHLKKLILVNSAITDILPLSNLTRLEILLIRCDHTRMKISDLSPLSGLKQLRELCFFGGSISRLEPLKELPLLETLNLGDNKIKDITPLSKIATLKKLDLTGNPLVTLEPLKKMAQLTECVLSGVKGEHDFSFLGRFQELRGLALWSNGISDISFLRGLNKLEKLEIGDNQMIDLAPLKDLKLLQELDISGNQVTDLVPLSGLKELEIFRVNRNQIQDLTPLGGMKKLTTLHFDQNFVSDISIIQNFNQLCSFSGDQNPITEIAPIKRLSTGELPDKISLVGTPVVDLTAGYSFHQIQQMCHRHFSLYHSFDQNMGSHLQLVSRVEQLFQERVFREIIEILRSVSQFRDSFISYALERLYAINSKTFEDLLIQMILEMPDLNSFLIRNIVDLFTNRITITERLLMLLKDQVPLYARITIFHILEQFQVDPALIQVDQLDLSGGLTLPGGYEIYLPFNLFEQNPVETGSIRFREGGAEVSGELLRYLIHLLITDNQTAPGVHKRIVKQIISRASGVQLVDKLLKSTAKWQYFRAGVFSTIVVMLEPPQVIKKVKIELPKAITGYRFDLAEQLLQGVVSLDIPGGWQMVEQLANFSDQKHMRSIANNLILQEAAKNHLTPDQFLDLKIPSYGFNRDHQLIFDYGSRTFTATITPKLTLSLLDNQTGKVIKSLPKPKGNDDFERANSAREYFNILKKDIVARVDDQRDRLERHFCRERLWPVPLWRSIFIDNPLMKQLATGLIWGILREGNLQSFRYLEDGTFSDHHKNEVVLPEDGEITLVYPSELEEYLIQSWRQRLEDDGVVQPFDQLGRICYRASGGDNHLSDFNGQTVDGGQLRNQLMKHGWNRGYVAGKRKQFFTYERIIDDIMVILNFSGDQVKPSRGSYQVILYDITFYRFQNGMRGEQIKPEMVPERLYSEIYLEVLHLQD